jgi:serine/threonine protein kinase
VCSGLAHAHEYGVIHRDIKPQNLLLTADQETVKIADFGVAKLEAADGVITRVGTNIYAAPEHNPLVQTAQLDTSSLSSANLTPAADIYSLAKTGYTLICGRSPRQFAHEPISKLPEHLAKEFWAASVLRVLERATRMRPGERYQSVQDFWDDLSDATLPQTMPLHVAERPVSITSDLNLPAALVAEAPPKPRFETSKELQHEAPGNGVRPRIVVPITNTRPMMTTPAFAAVQSPGRVTVSVPAAAPNVALDTAQKRSKGLRAALVSVILIVAFSGMLLATRNYIRSRWAQQSSQQTSLVGREGVTTTDLNLRAGPGSANDQVGMAESGSRVKVLNVSSNINWCEVQVLQHARPKDDPTSADRGWVNKRFLKFD